MTKINPKTRRPAGNRPRRLCAYINCRRGDDRADGRGKKRAEIFSSKAGQWGGLFCCAACRTANYRMECGAKQIDIKRACVVCGAVITEKQNGRKKSVCGNACRVKKHRREKAGLPVADSAQV